MFSFRKKKQPPAASDLAFKSNVAAFQFACKYLNTALENEMPVLAIVLGAHRERGYCLKVSNPHDASVPSESPKELLDSGRIDNICWQALPTDRAGNLGKGDLVMYVAPAELAALGKGHMTGVIIAKVQPRYSTAHGSWLNA